MKSQRRHDKPELKNNRKQLRKNGTPAEAFYGNSWAAKNWRIVSLDGSIVLIIIVDFYCASEKLIIELDGEVHNNPSTEEYDKKRSEHLEKLGFTIIRFENKMVFDHVPSVLVEIRDNFQVKNWLRRFFCAGMRNLFMKINWQGLLRMCLLPLSRGRWK